MGKGKKRVLKNVEENVIALFHCRKDVGDQKKIAESYRALRGEGFKKVIGSGIWGILSPVIILGGIFQVFFL